MPDKIEDIDIIEVLNTIEFRLSHIEGIVGAVPQTIASLVNNEMQKVFGKEYWSTWRQLIEDKGPLLQRLDSTEQKLNSIRSHTERLIGIERTCNIRHQDQAVINQLLLDHLRKKPRWKFW